MFLKHPTRVGVIITKYLKFFRFIFMNYRIGKYILHGSIEDNRTYFDFLRIFYYQNIMELLTENGLYFKKLELLYPRCTSNFGSFLTNMLKFCPLRWKRSNESSRDLLVLRKLQIIWCDTRSSCLMSYDFFRCSYLLSQVYRIYFIWKKREKHYCVMEPHNLSTLH